jgi:hypothetical protein
VREKFSPGMSYLQIVAYRSIQTQGETAESAVEFFSMLLSIRKNVLQTVRCSVRLPPRGRRV